MSEDTVLETMQPEGIIEKVGDIVEDVLTLPNLNVELNVLTDKVDAIYNRVALMGLVEFLLVIAVIYLLWKSFKK